MAASVYLLVFTGRNYLALREKRLANAAIIATQKEIEVSSESAVVPGQEDTSPKPWKRYFLQNYIGVLILIWGSLSWGPLLQRKEMEKYTVLKKGESLLIT